jgi:diguanylate cyclase (GGDEF)-like protein
LWGLRKSGAAYPKWQTINVIRDESGEIANFLAVFRDISEAKEQEQKLWELAHFDNLTGVANRSLMYTNLRLAVSQAKRENLQVAVMMFDLDGFKLVNDTLGHDAGDQLLKHVARQIKAIVREVDTVARLGGDEFTVILTGVGKREDVAYVAQKILVALGQPLKLESGQEVVARASIGIALYPDNGADIETLMKNADRAMYRAKGLGKNNFQFFVEGMTAESKPGSLVA